MSFRVDADYREPRAAGTARPFDVVYRWKENGQDKMQRKRVERLPATYTIETGAAPEMASVSYEMPVQ